MPLAVHQGTIQIPLFLAPYQVANIAEANGGFNNNSDWAVTVPYAQIYNPGFGGLVQAGGWFKMRMCNPFNSFVWTNNAAQTLGNLGVSDGGIFVCADGKAYLGCAGSTWIQEFAYTEMYWNMAAVDISNQILNQNRVIQTSNPGFGPTENLIMGKANFPAYGPPQLSQPAICGHTRHGNACFMPPVPPYLPNWTGYTNWLPLTGGGTLNIQCKPDTNKMDTHFVTFSTTGGSPFMSHSNVTFIPGSPAGAIVNDNSYVTIDNGVSTAFANAFNSTSNQPIVSISKAPQGWLVKLVSQSGTPFQFILFDVYCRRYWTIQTTPQSSIPLTGPWNDNLIQSMHIDPTGVAYVLAPGAFNPSTIVAHSYGFNLPWYPIALNMSNVPTFSLPCPPPCVNVRGKI